MWIVAVTALSSLAAFAASAADAEKAKEIRMFDQSRDLPDSLRMGEPGELKGVWSVSGGNVRCRIELRDERVEAANGWRLADAAGCLAGLVPGVVAWRPAPDGIEFAGADGLTLVMFDSEGKGRAPSGAPLTLTRAR